MKIKINKLLLGTSLLPTFATPIISLSSCSSDINGVKSISTKFEIKETISPSYASNPHYGVFTANIIFNQNIKKIDVNGKYVINGSSVLIDFNLPTSTQQSTAIKGNLIATAIDDSIYTVSYSYNVSITSEWIQYAGGSSGFQHTYASSVYGINFEDPTKLK